METNLPGHLKLIMDPGEHPALVLMVEPNGEKPVGVTSSDLRRLIHEQNFDGWFVSEEQISLFEREQHNVKGTKGYRIAECLDAQVSVHITEDRLEARISIVPPYGGKPVNEGMVRNELEASGVVFGIVENAIREAVLAGHCEELVVASGIPPQLGRDVQFEPLVKEPQHKGRPNERADGSVDYYDLGLYVSVGPGTPILRKIPPTAGVSGTGVDGNPILAKTGKDKDVRPGPGTELSGEDPNLLVATVGGQPVFNYNSAKIVGKLEVGDVNYETGNIDFDGSVYVRGIIQAGFKVKAGGDILVGDTVERADLSAGGSIQFRCGVFGHNQNRIIAKGNIKAKFLNECTVYCEGNIEVEDLIANCTIVCEGKVEVGQKGGKGQIYGGKMLATKGVHAKIFGSVTEMSTIIEACPSPALVTRDREIIKEVKKLGKNLEDVEKSLNFLKGSSSHHNDPRIDSLTEACFLIVEKLETLKGEKEELEAKLHVPILAKVMANEAHPGVVVAVGSRRKTVTSPTRSFCLDPSAED